ncbi:Tn3 family transposase [Rickettsia endosymbiont of Orchestes rusci]|uniref:Tn3 family transposase n=1 Tax=Rickettsia endosymbiont of Orchestes rusci TaxID=3066250 RepID=UPI00313B59B6
MNKKTRIILLSNAEIEELYSLPVFTEKDRETFFALSNSDHTLLLEYRTLKLKIYFILQLGYFRATQQFYNFNFEEILDDVTYLINRYFTQSQNTLTDKPYREKIKAQQNTILKLHRYTDWTPSLTVVIMTHLLELIRYYPKAQSSLRELFKYFENERIVIPKYRTLQDIFSKAFSTEEARLNNIISFIPDNIKQQLTEVVNNDGSIRQLNSMRCDQKNFQYTAVKLEIKKVQKIEELYQFCKSFIPQLGISKNGIKYYGELAENYYASRLRKMGETQQWLYLVCFLYNRYRQFMDNLIITFQHHMASIIEAAKNHANVASIHHSAEIVLEFPKLAKFLKWFPSKEKNDTGCSYDELIQEAYTILPKAQFELLAAFIEGKTFDKTLAKWEFYTKSSASFSRYLRPIMLAVGFELANQNSYLIKLIEFLKTHYSKGRYPAALKVKTSDNIGLVIAKWILPYLKSDYDSEYLDPYRFEFYVYWKMNCYITKGRLVCNDSLSYSDLDYDLVPENLVDNVEEIATKFGYHKIPIYCNKHLDKTLQNLDLAWNETNANIDNGTNEGLEITKDEEGTISWKLLYEAKEKLDDSFFSNLPKIEITDLLKFIGDRMHLWNGFTHIKHRYIKRKKPVVSAVSACLLSEAFGFNIPQMAEICDINLNILRSTRQDFIRVESLSEANDITSNYINGLSIFKEWNLLDRELLADADGKKHSTSNNTIQSRYSKKYFGKGKGISIYSLVANHVVVNARCIGLNEYEGHGLYDIVCGNKSNIAINYVTGDNHSINPVNFVVLDSVDIGYLPSIKNIKDEAKKLYSHMYHSTCKGAVKPKGQIDVALIKSKEKWILRVLLSLVLQENTQTTIIRKLSSHDRYSQLNSALFEYNKIFKSIHVLNMINDIKLRKAIKTARNRTENYHQLQGIIRKVYNGVFKGKKIIDNRVSAQAAKFVANCIIAYSSTMLDILYQKIIEENASQAVIDQFVRISPIAWGYIIFTGHYNFKKNIGKIDLEKMIDTLEEKLRKTLWKQG